MTIVAYFQVVVRRRFPRLYQRWYNHDAFFEENYVEVLRLYRYFMKKIPTMYTRQLQITQKLEVRSIVNTGTPVYFQKEQITRKRTLGQNACGFCQRHPAKTAERLMEKAPRLRLELLQQNALYRPSGDQGLRSFYFMCIDNNLWKLIYWALAQPNRPRAKR